MRSLFNNLILYTVMLLVFFLPERKRIAIERWLRGYEEDRKLKKADWVLASWGKSGRTWLRVMLSRAYQLKFGIASHHLLDFDNLKEMNPGIPSVFFTHGNYLKDYTGHRDTKVDFYGKKIVLLIRDPRDVAVSQFFQWKFRMKPGKKKLNNYPAHEEDISLFDFVMNPDVGAPHIVEYFNGWARDMDNLEDLILVRYEDMRVEPEKVLAEILAFTGTPCTEEEVREAVEFAAYDNMKKLETKKAFWFSGKRVVPGDRNNPDSYKVRRAKVGGYRDYFDDREVAEIDAVMDRLSPLFGYAKQGAQDTAANG